MSSSPQHGPAFQRLVCCALIAALLFFGLWAVRAAALAPDYSPLLVTDFINDWTAAHLARDGQLAGLFDLDWYQDIMATLWGAPVEFHSWSYPIHLLPLLIPFAALGYFPALFLWSALGLLAYGWAARQHLPRAWVWLVLLSPASLVNLAHGQTGFFCAALFLGGLYALAKRPWFAGVLFGLLTLKPHLGLLIAPLLVLRGEWRAAGMAVLAAGFLIGISLLQWGTDPWVAFFETTRHAQLALLDQFQGFYMTMMPGVMAGARGLGLPLSVAWVLQATVALPVAVAVLVLVQREGLTPRSILALALGAVLVTPYAFNYDMTLVSLALAVYLRQTQRVTPLWLFLWAAPVLVYFLGLLHLPLVAIAMVAGIARLFRESAASHVANEK